MDDQRFDESIKRKIGEYEPPEFDPMALASLHHKMAASNAWPWYSRYRTEVLVGSGMILCTLLILLNQWYVNNSSTQQLKDEAYIIQIKNAQIEQLQCKIADLQSTLPDTVRIVAFRQSTEQETTLLQRIAALEMLVFNMNKNNAVNKESIHNRKTLAQDFSSLPGALDEWNDESDINLFSKNTTRLTPSFNHRKSLKAEPKSFVLRSSTRASHSVKTIRSLEKHYRKGIGIRVGPSLEISNGMYTSGKMRMGFVGGIVGDFILSPALSLESGLKYSHRIYENSNIKSLTEANLPNVNPDLGTLSNTDIDSWILELPIHVKYRYPLSMRVNLIGGVGYSSLIYLKQLLEYNYVYEFENNTTASVNSTYRTEEAKRYAGLLNTSLGVSKQLKNNKILETSLYYQHGLGKTGVENAHANFIGLRGVYWFSVR